MTVELNAKLVGTTGAMSLARCSTRQVQKGRNVPGQW